MRLCRDWRTLQTRMHEASATPTPLAFIPPQDEARAFARMRYRMYSTRLRQTLVEARFRLVLIVVLTSLLWGAMLWMFVDGFQFLQQAIPHPETYARAIGAMFGTFFAALMVMLIFSAGIILYSFLYCATEMTLLLTIPARTERVFLQKFQEALVLTSWGFVFLASPMLLAYGLVERAPWYYYAMLLPFLIAFIYIPVALGGITCLCVVRRVPQSRTAVLVGVGAVLLVAVAYLAWSLLCSPQNDLLTPGWFQEVLGRLQFSEQRLLPSWWLTEGLLDASTGAWSESLLFLTLTISNALFFRQLALWTAGRIYRDSYSGLYGRLRRRKRARPMLLDRLLSSALWPLSATVRLMLIKDLRLFRRDPLQWSQFLIFLGLLAIYFANVRRFTYNINYAGWVNMVSFLNLAVVGLLLSTFTTRFIFPMISLEGQRFWILGVLPVRRETILWSKFLFATGGSIVPCTLLVLLSDSMLDVSPLLLASHQVTCLLLCLGLAGIAVGLARAFQTSASYRRRELPPASAGPCALLSAPSTSWQLCCLLPCRRTSTWPLSTTGLTAERLAWNRGFARGLSSALSAACCLGPSPR